MKKKPTTNLTQLGEILSDGEIAEAIFDGGQTAFLVGNEHRQSCKSSIVLSDEITLVPPKPDNNLLRHRVILLPSAIKEYGDEEVLLWEIEAYIRRYCDLDPKFIKTAASYIMLTWVYDRFNEVPYLRLLGNYGTGKTRFLTTVGSIAYRPVFGSGASTVSPIFHLLNRYKGTLILDEADFRFSDQTADISKILNNGNVRGFPVLRCMRSGEGRFEPEAFQVFGPKIIATRGRYADPALESRFITEVVYPIEVAGHIPVNLPEKQSQEAEQLRNQLLLFRFRNWHRTDIRPDIATAGPLGRIGQIFRPLLSVVPTDKDRQIVLDVALREERNLEKRRCDKDEVRLLHSLERFFIASKRPTLKQLAEDLRATDAVILSSKEIGHLLRRFLKVETYKSGGVFKVKSLSARQLREAADVLGVRLSIDCGSSAVSRKPPSSPHRPQRA